MTVHHLGNAATVRILATFVGTAREMVYFIRKLVVSGSRRSGTRKRRDNCALWQVSWGVSLENLVRLTPMPALQPLPTPPSEMSPRQRQRQLTQVTQSSVLTVPATQSPSPDGPMETSETTTEPGRDLDVCMDRTPTAATERAGRC